MIDCVVFDLDDVVIPTAPLFGTLAREFGIRANPFRRFLRGPYRKTLTGGADLIDILPPFLLEWQWPHSAADFLAAWFTAADTCDANILAIARTLKQGGISCALASNQERRRAAHLEAHTELVEVFAPRLYSCDLGQIKPHPEFFTRAATALDMPPRALLLLDDRAKNVEAARRAGWQAEHACDGTSVRSALAAHALLID